MRPDDELSLDKLWGRILRGGAWVVTGKGVAAISTVAAQALLARLLSPTDVGTYFLIFSVITIAATISHVGLNFAVVRFSAKALAESDDAGVRKAITLTLKWGIAGAAVVAIALIPIGRVLGERIFRAEGMSAAMAVAAVWMFFFAVQSLLAESYRGLHDVRTATLLAGVASGVFTLVGFGLLAVSTHPTSLKTVLLVSSTATAIVVIAGGLGLLRLLRRFTGLATLTVRTLMRTSLPLWASSLMLIIIGQLDLWIVGAFMSSDSVAIYGAAWRIVALISMPLLIVNGVLPPVITQLHSQGHLVRLQNTLQRTAFIAGAPAALLLVIVAVHGGWILAAVYGGYYSAGAGIISILSIGQVMNVMSGSCGLTLMMTGHQDTMMTISLISAVVMVLTSLLLMKYWGLEGVAAGAAGGLALQNLLMWWGAKVKTGVTTHASLRSFLRAR